MKIGPRYIGVVNIDTISAHIQALNITDTYKIKMNPINFEALLVEYRLRFEKDFLLINNLSGISIECSEATPVNRICVVNNEEACSF